MLIPLSSGFVNSYLHGGKAEGLVGLQNAQIRVPKTYLLPYDLLIKLLSIENSSNETYLASLGDTALNLSANIKSLFEESPMWIFRSSASCEDGVNTAMAGQFHSQLAFDLPSALNAIQACWNSLNDSQARNYLEVQQGEISDSSSDLTMAVIVQQWIEPKISGITFTQDQHVITEAIWGQGRLLVGGYVTPDRYMNTDVRQIHTQTFCAVTADTDELFPGDPVTVQLDQDLSFKTTVEVFQMEERVAFVALDEIVGASACLSLSMQSEINCIARSLQTVFGWAIDTEWVIDANDTLWWVQVRRATRTLPIGAIQNQSASQGTPVSGGRISAPAWVAHTPEEALKSPPGCILVAPMTTPLWTSALMRAVGVLTEEGGILSHTAIVARELGIPALVGCDISQLCSGMWLEVDGDMGMISIHSENEYQNIAVNQTLTSQTEHLKPILIFDAALQPVQAHVAHVHMPVVGSQA